MAELYNVEIKEKHGSKVVKKTIGQIHNGTFYKRVKKSIHFYRKTASWGIDAGAFDTVISIECHTIKILDKENDILYTTSVENFKNNGDYLHFKPHRVQLFLNLLYFKTEKKYQKNKKK